MAKKLKIALEYISLPFSNVILDFFLELDIELRKILIFFKIQTVTFCKFDPFWQKKSHEVQKSLD
jgi:hypothetical protein